MGLPQTCYLTCLLHYEKLQISSSWSQPRMYVYGFQEFPTSSCQLDITNVSGNVIRYGDINRQQNPQEQQQQQEQQQVTKDVKIVQCTDPVWSLAFGASKPHKKWKHINIKYHHFEHLDSSYDLIIAIGLKSGKIMTVDIATEQILLLVDHKDVIRDLKFSPDGSLILLSASRDRTLKVWDLKDDGNMVVTLRGHSNWVYACAFAPDMSMLASVGSQKCVIVWDMKDRNLRKCKILRRLTGHHHDVVACEFSPDGALLATASYDTRVLLWDPHLGKLLQEYHHVFPPLSIVFAGGCNNNYVKHMAFSPDGSHFATVCDDKYIRFWSLFDTSDPVSVSDVRGGLCCSYSADGHVLATGTRNGTVHFLMAPKEVQTLQHTCRLAIRRLVPNTNDLDMLNLPPGLSSYLRYDILS
ncbi:WD repeat and SOCS box-containing protein 1-like isoform X2 [Acanthaster planci]|uniref:WD repeat and SOCS box-containing protein 1-like isoform X2 n=1 Tax=Acanthaster planci TaxID=133434 RepID=A0A8B7ZP24_ACAPL|nr:WD repeat and SOCS box-containing protein 1-like isoform X2 [Acanthaster planci]